MLFKYCRNTCGEKVLWKYVLYCLNNKNCCSNNVIKHSKFSELYNSSANNPPPPQIFTPTTISISLSHSYGHSRFNQGSRVSDDDANLSDACLEVACKDGRVRSLVKEGG